MQSVFVFVSVIGSAVSEVVEKSFGLSWECSALWVETVKKAPELQKFEEALTFLRPLHKYICSECEGQSGLFYKSVCKHPDFIYSQIKNM